MQAAAESLLDDGLERPGVLHPLDEADVRSNRNHLIGSQESKGANDHKTGCVKARFQFFRNILAACKCSAAR